MFATAGSADAAGFAEAVVQVWTRTARRSPLIFGLRIGSRSRAKVIEADEHKPSTRLRADGAIAPVGTFAEIDVSFEADGAAMTASEIGFQGHSSSSSFPAETNDPIK